MESPDRDVVRTTLSLMLIGVLTGAGLWVLKPFLVAAVWAAMTVIATWPIMQFFERKLWHSRGLAAGVMTVLLLLLFLVPFCLVIMQIVGNADEITNWIKSLRNFATPEAPGWLKGLPYFGARLATRWQEILAAIPGEVRSRLLPHVGGLLKWFVGQVGSLGALLVDFLFTLIIAAVLYLKGDSAAAGVRLFARRIAGPRGEDAAWLAAQAIRAVAAGVVVSAIVLAAFTYIGLIIVGIPCAVLLAGVSFLLSLAQLGVLPVLLPGTLWLYWRGESGWAALLLVWTIFASALDHLLRPVLIKRSGNLSLLLILPGVVGGLVAFGLIGIFIGPMVLAVTYTLLEAWVKDDRDISASKGESNS